MPLCNQTVAMYAPCGRFWGFSLSSEITSTSAGCSMRQGGAQPGVAISFWFPLGKEKLIETGNYGTCSVCWLEPDRRTLWWYRCKCFTERMFFFLQSQHENHSVYALLMMLFPETLEMLEAFEVQFFSTPNLMFFLSFGGNRGLMKTSLSQLLRGHGCLVTWRWKLEIGNMDVLFEALHS